MVEILRNIHLVDDSFANVYLILREGRAIAIDAGEPGNEHKVLKYMSNLGLDKESLDLIIITHAHYDHIGALANLKRLTGAKVAAHKDEVPYIRGEKSLHGYTPEPVEIDIVLSGGETLNDLLIIHTPGHTPGSICILHRGTGALFIGDLVHEENGVLYEIPTHYSLDPELNRKSIASLINISNIKHILPSHGRPIIGRGYEALKNLVSRLKT